MKPVQLITAEILYHSRVFLKPAALLSGSFLFCALFQLFQDLRWKVKQSEEV